MAKRTGPAREPLGDRDLSELDAGEVRVLCFGDAGPPSRWACPGTALVARRLCVQIDRMCRSNPFVAGSEKDLYDAVYVDVWNRFEDILETFRASGRPQRWSSWESYLQTSICNGARDQVRRVLGREFPGVVGDVADQQPQPPGDPDPLARIDARRILAGAFRVLPDDEREAFLDRHVHDRPAAHTEERLGKNRAGVFKLRHRALKRFRNEVIRIVAADAKQVRGADRILDGIVSERCTDGHPCFLYDLGCRLAREPEAIGARIGGVGAAHVSRTLESFARDVSADLARHEVPPQLDGCLWESYRSRARTGTDHG